MTSPCGVRSRIPCWIGGQSQFGLPLCLQAVGDLGQKMAGSCIGA